MGARKMVGHGGGFPGQSTRTVFDPEDQLVVVVFSNTNASDGLAAPLAETVVKIIDFAMSCASEVPSAVPLEGFTGRFANRWGTTDIVAFGASLKVLSPEADNPVDRVTDLEVVDENTLRITRTNGYASPGEPVTYEREPSGQITRVRIAGSSSYPVDIFRERYGS